jgi:hypothetical protein
MLTPCTACGCCWDDDGFYHYKGEIQQPCVLCRQDTQSINYWNNRETILAKQRESYHADLERNREFRREQKRQQRAHAKLSQISYAQS